MSQRAITAADADELLPHAQDLATSILGVPVDFRAVLDGAPISDVVADRLDANALEFLHAVVNVLRRVSTRRDRERLRLAEVEGRFHRIFQHCPVALGMSTLDGGRVIDVNEHWLSLFGYQRAEVIGRTNAELSLTVDPPRDELARQLAAAGMLRDVEMKVRTCSGEIRDIIVSAVPHYAADEGRVWISACVDITGRKQAEAERGQLLAREQTARNEAEQALEKLQAVYEVTGGITASGPLGDLLGDVLRRLRRTLQIDHATVFVLDEEERTLHLRAIEGPEEIVPLPVVRVPLGSGVSGRVAAEGRPMIVNDDSTIDSSGVQSDTRRHEGSTHAVMGAPFTIGDRVAGVVMVSTLTPRRFTAEELRLLVLAAERVAPAIERGRLIERIRTGVQRQRTLSRRLLTAQEEERRRVAVELHDELGQILTAVKINLESLERAPDADATPPRLSSMIESVDDALQRVKDIALDLRPSVLDDLGLEAALRWFTDRLARHAGVAAHLSIDALPVLEPGLQTACFRVTQEALTNVDRHARAHQVWIDLHVLDGALELTVRDDGVGFDVAAAKARAISGESVGLLGMQERVSLLGGDYDILRIPSGGTQVRARFPLSTGAPE